MIMSSITVRSRIAGTHHWPDAPRRRRYLEDEHRHLFHLELTVNVTHDDREVEFHDLQDILNEAFIVAATGQHPSGLLKFGAQSCEMIAQRILDYVLEGNGWTDRVLRVVVGEDGENNAMLVYTP